MNDCGDDVSSRCSPRPGPDAVPTLDAERPDSSVKASKSIKVIFAHDLSGSMEPRRQMIADGTNEFVQDLQARYVKPCEFDAKFCLMTFSGDKIVVGEWSDIHDVPMFTIANFVCTGSTPLWDTCAVGLDKIHAECAGCTAVLYCFTDGDDNNSKRFNSKSIRERIAALNPEMHTMLFIGSDPLSSVANAEAIGVSRTRTLNPSSDNTPSAMRACTNAIARCVTGETQTPEFNVDDIAMSEGPSASAGGSAQSYDVVDDGNGNDDMQTPTISRRWSGGACI